MSDKEMSKRTRGQGLRFGRGQRRASGRTKGSQNRKTIAKMIAEEIHEIAIDRQRVRLTTAQLLLHLVNAEATAGGLSASRWLDELEDRFTAGPDAGGFLVVPEILSIDEWIAEQERLNLTRTDPRLKDHSL